MPPRSKVEGLPKAVKEWLDRALVDGNFAGYEALAAELKSRGHDISKTAVHRYGQAFEERMKMLKVSTEQARAVIEASPDDEDTINQAMMRVTQEKAFQLMMAMEVDPETVDFAKITRAIADLARSSTTVKDYARKVKAKAAEAAAEVGDTLKGAGLSNEAVEAIKQRILGVA